MLELLAVVAYLRRDDAGLGELSAAVARETPKADHGLTPWSWRQILLQHVSLDCWDVCIDDLPGH